jgi:hypothetical protein
MRISFSSAKAWWDGRKDDCIKMMLHEETALPIRFQFELDRIRAMAMGNGYHSAWELESKVTGQLPAMFKIPAELGVVATELKLTKELPDGNTLSGVIDAVLIDPEIPMIILADYKSGLAYDPRQADVYHFLVHDNPQWKKAVGDFNPSHAMFLCFDKKTGEPENSIIQLSYPKTQREWDLPEATTYTRGINWVMTIIDDIKADGLAMAKLGQVI